MDTLVMLLGIGGISVATVSMLANTPKNTGSATVEAWHKLHDREKIKSYLPYEDYIEQDGLYVTSDGGIGLVIKCTPVPGAGEKVHDALGTAMDMLPEGASFQFLLYAGTDIHEIVDGWRRQKRPGNDLSREIIRSYAGFLEKKAHEHVSRNFAAPVRNVRLIFTVKHGGKDKKQSLFSIMKKGGPENSAESVLRRRYDELANIKERIIGSLSAGGLNPVVLDPDGLLRAVYPVINPHMDFRNIPKWDGTRINNFMVSRETFIKNYDEHITIADSVWGKSMSVKEYPEHWGISDVARYLGDIIENTNIGVPCIVALNVIKYPESEKGVIKRNASLVLGQQMPYALFPRLRIKHEDLQYGMERLEKNESLYHATFGLYVFAESEEELKEACGEIKAYYRRLSFRLEEDRYINFPALLTMLPLGHDSQMVRFLDEDRGRAVFGENVADLAPVSSDWSGNGHTIPLISPRGQLTGFDIFSEATGGYNGFVVGMTGSGKSVFLQWIALNHHLAGDRVWIIDIGGSYERFTKAFGGQYIELKREEPLCLNPFTHITDDALLHEYLDFLIDFFLLLGMPRERQMSQQQEKLIKSYLEDAVRSSYAEYGTDSCIDTVAEALEGCNDNDGRVSDFIKTLRPYRSAGQYGAFFNGRSTIEFASDIVTMENGTIENIQDLRDPALMLLTFHISREIYLADRLERNRRHVVIIDEAHKFLGKSEHIDLFIEQAYRRFRKHDAAMLLGTQGFEDFTTGGKVSQAGRVIIQNSKWKFFMLQSDTSVRALQQQDLFSFGEYGYEILRKLRPVPGEYGEVMIASDGVTAKARIVLDDLLQILMFSEQNLRSRIQELIKEGRSHIEAVKIIKEEQARSAG